MTLGFAFSSTGSPNDQQAPSPHLRPAYRPDIDGLRAIAILSVLIFHAFPSALPGGFVGVDVFFVISGFLISSIIFKGLGDGSFRFINFYAHRAKRIFPALITVLVTSIVVGWGLLLPLEFSELGRHVAAGAFFVQNIVLWQEAGYFDTASELKPLMHLWSLAVEEQFYIIYPIILFLFYKIKRPIILAIVFIFVVSFVSNVSLVSKFPTSTFFLPGTRFWELLSGGLVAYFAGALHRRVPDRVLSALSVLGLTLIVVACFTVRNSYAFPGWWALLPVAGAALLISAGPGGWINRYLLSQRAMVLIGLISYPLYLWHWPLLSFARIAEGKEPSLLFRFLLVLASVVLAWLTYRFIERPIRFGWTSRRIALGLTGALSVIGVLGIGTVALGGFPDRFAPEIVTIANFKYSYTDGTRAKTCWISRSDPFDGFAPECLVQPKASRPSVFLWGDSHAGLLYPGLRSVLGDDVDLSQMTRDGCPPLKGLGYDVCQKSNAYVLEQLNSSRPQTVILFAVWGEYDSAWQQGTKPYQALMDTIRTLKDMDIENIVVVGPAPHWRGNLPKLVYQAWRQSSGSKIPDRLKEPLEQNIFPIDKNMAKTITDAGVSYVSLLTLLCSEEGCMTHVPGKSDALFSWDDGHMTIDGARFVAPSMMASVKNNRPAVSDEAGLKAKD